VALALLVVLEVVFLQMEAPAAMAPAAPAAARQTVMVLTAAVVVVVTAAFLVAVVTAAPAAPTQHLTVLTAPEAAEEAAAMVELPLVVTAATGVITAAAAEVVEGFLNDPQYQEEALAAMLRRGRDVEMGDPEIMLDGLMTQIRKAERDEDVAATVSFVLTEFTARAEYDRILELARMPVLQRKPVQDMIGLHVSAAFRRDLTSDNPLRNLTAIRALASEEADLLDGIEDRDGYFDLAAARAERFGFPTLAARLASRIGAEDGTARYTAERAYRLGDFDTVIRVARGQSGQDRTAFLGALSAVRTNDPEALKTVLPRVPRAPVNVLRLIEADADSGHWILPEALFEVAQRFEDEAHQKRAERVLAMRDATFAERPAPANMSIADIGDALARSEAVLNKLGKETF